MKLHLCVASGVTIEKPLNCDLGCCPRQLFTLFFSCFEETFVAQWLVEVQRSVLICGCCLVRWSCLSLSFFLSFDRAMGAGRTCPRASPPSLSLSLSLSLCLSLCTFRISTKYNDHICSLVSGLKLRNTTKAASESEPQVAMRLVLRG